MNMSMNKMSAWAKKNIVAIGGGNGLSCLLSGIKKYTKNISAVVTVTDDGGSSGSLRDEFCILPPGDIRNCLVALADEETLLSKLFQYRFSGEGSLSGHSFGNLFLMAMSDIMNGFDKGISESSKVLAIRGKVLPVTLEKVRLKAEFDDHSVVYGQTNIARTKKKIRTVSLFPIEQPSAAPHVLNVLARADIITLGPGSLFTSVIPNLLVQGVSDAIAHSPAIKVYICNIMTQPWETYHFTATDHYRALKQVLGDNVIDYVFLNSGKIPDNIKQQYRKENSIPVKDDFNFKNKKNIKVKCLNLMHYNHVVRHNPDALAKAVLSVA